MMIRLTHAGRVKKWLSCGGILVFTLALPLLPYAIHKRMPRLAAVLVLHVLPRIPGRERILEH